MGDIPYMVVPSLLVTLMIALVRTDRESERSRSLALALLLLVVDCSVLKAGRVFHDAHFAELHLHWNWLGKILATSVTLIAAWRIRDLTPARLGYTLKQAPGSVWPALVCLLLICLWSLSSKLVTGGGPDLSLERFWYQATMPGIEEETFFRGLWLALLLQVMPDRWRIFGAPFGSGGVAITLVFGLLHGLTVHGGRYSFDPLSFLFPTVAGFGFLWIRQRTGSIWLAVLAHNVSNVLEGFV